MLLLVGALSKSAIIPFHFWLPGAMAAPTPVSAYLHAAAMVKAGVYLVALLAPAFAGAPAWHALTVGLGLATMLLGGWRALRQHDLKLLLAYGTVSQLGFMVAITGIGTRAAALATRLGVGVEIDYVENTDPDLVGLQAFIDAYRAVHPYDATGNDPAARLTIDLAAGDRWLIALTRKATADWLRTDVPVLDYANAMVPAKQPSSSAAIANWQEHVDGKPQYAPPIPPLAPAKFTGSLYVAEGSRVRPECNDFANSLQKATASFVQGVMPNGAGLTNGMLGFMFWAAEKPLSATVVVKSCVACLLTTTT